MYPIGMTAVSLLKEARRRAGLTQTELATRAAKAPSAISRWERGDTQPSLQMLEDLIRAAGFELVLSLSPIDDHDLVLIRRSLMRNPAERLDEMVAAVRALDSMAAANG